MSIEKLDPQAMVRKKGFRSRKPDAMTNAEKQRKYRLSKGGRTINTTLAPDIAACFIYLRKEWGMQSDREVMEAAVRFLTICTRQGLTRLPQRIDD
jgi:hypothetical protein